MSSNVGAGNDGLGGGALPTPPPDATEADRFDPIAGDDFAGDEFAPDPGVGAETRGESDPWAVFGDRADAAREVAQRKGFRSPDQLIDAYNNAESSIGRQGNEVATLRQQVEELTTLLDQQAGIGAAPGQQQPAQLPMGPWSDLDWNRLQEETGGDPVAMMQLYHGAVLPELLAQREQSIRQELTQQFSAGLRPVAEVAQRTTLRDQATELMREFPEEFPAMREEIVAHMQRNNLVGRPNGMRTAFEHLYTRRAAQERNRRRASLEGESLLGGRGPGRARAAVDPEADIRAAIEEAALGSSRNDGLT